MSDLKPYGQEEKKPSVIWKMIKIILSIMFPIFKMLSLNRLLTLSERTLGNVKDKDGKYIDPYGFLPRQRRKNILVSMMASIPIVLGVFSSYMTVSTNADLSKALSLVKKDVVELHPVKAFKKVSIVREFLKLDPASNSDFNFAIYSILVGVGISAAVGSIIVYKHPILQDTEKLKALLARSGYIKLDENPTVLATPIGVLVDLTGHTPQEVADTKYIWIALNVKINRDAVENVNKRSLVFFKFNYELKEGGDYGFKTIPEQT